MRTTYSDDAAVEIDKRIHKIKRGVGLDFRSLPEGHPDMFEVAPGGTRVNIICLRANLTAMARLLEVSGAFTWKEYAETVVEELDLAVMELERRVGKRIGKGVEIL